MESYNGTRERRFHRKIEIWLNWHNSWYCQWVANGMGNSMGDRQVEGTTLVQLLNDIRVDSLSLCLTGWLETSLNRIVNEDRVKSEFHPRWNDPIRWNEEKSDGLLGEKKKKKKKNVNGDISPQIERNVNLIGKLGSSDHGLDERHPFELVLPRCRDLPVVKHRMW
jgi:hypothetical protein